MTELPPFKLEVIFSRWEFDAPYNLAASDAESLSLRELLAHAEADDREAFESAWLGYTTTRGDEDLRDAIASLYAARTKDDLLCFAGAEEGLYTAMRVLLKAGDHAIVVTPCYQSAETVPRSLCDVTGVPLDPDDDWSLDVDRLAAALRPNTKVISINFPHNPTGKILERDRFEALLALCQTRGIWLFSDEVYRGLGVPGTVHLPNAADVYERGISLGVLSKAYGLPGLRIGWIASADRQLLTRLERYKHYLSICNAAPSERLGVIALKAGEKILQRNCRIVADNLDRLDPFFSEHGDFFDYRRPDGGCIAYPRYLGAEGVERFADRMIMQAGVLLLPASTYRSTLCPAPADRFRIGFGRSAFPGGLAAMQRHLCGRENPDAAGARQVLSARSECKPE